MTMFKNTIRIACKLGTVIRMGNFTMGYTDIPDMSASTWLPDPNNPNELIKHNVRSEALTSRKRIMKS